MGKRLRIRDLVYCKVQSPCVWWDRNLTVELYDELYTNMCLSQWLRLYEYQQLE